MESARRGARDECAGKLVREEVRGFNARVVGEHFHVLAEFLGRMLFDLECDVVLELFGEQFGLGGLQQGGLGRGRLVYHWLTRLRLQSLA